jgi:nucleotide-binding universal stress UspA family protein
LTQRKTMPAEVPDDPAHRHPLGAPMKILLAIDGSPVTKRMLSYVAAHDELFGAEHDYALITVATPVPGYAARFLEKKTVDDYYREEAERVFKPVRAFAEMQHWKVKLIHAHGNAAEVIATTAEAEHSDLLVMGTHGHSSLGNVVMGSVATGVLARCKRPVLLIP